MRLLVDTNVYLEVLLNQASAAEARALLAAVDEHDFFVSDFALHSIGIALIRNETTILTCAVADLVSVARWARELNLDFDDSYQYSLAENEDLVIVSYDAHFDRTRRGRRTPGQIVGAGV